MKINSSLISSENYSTTKEKIVGYLDDTKPIYRKTYKVTTASQANTWKSFNANITNLDTILDIRGGIKRGSSNNYWHPIPCYEDSNIKFEFSVSFSSSQTYVYYRQGSEFTNGTFSLTLEYTKTN